MKKPITGNPDVNPDKTNLQDFIYSTPAINTYYMEERPAAEWIANRTDVEAIADEQWKPITKKGMTIGSVSTFGRIKNKDGTILPLFEGYEDKSVHIDLTRDVFSSVDDGHVGWVCAELNGTVYFVYQLVAEAYLEPGDEIHHITNDGYDNSIYNLISLSESEHKSINHCKHNGKTDYVPPIHQHLESLKK